MTEIDSEQLNYIIKNQTCPKGACSDCVCSKYCFSNDLVNHDFNVERSMESIISYANKKLIELREHKLKRILK